MARDTTFSVVLHSASEVSTRSLCLPTFPDTVTELQRHIETEYSVPRCCQSVFFEGLPLRGDDSLRDHRVRNGDTFHVRYESEADVEDIRKVVEDMQRFLKIVKDAYDNHPDYFSKDAVHDVIPLFDHQVKSERVECLAIQYFRPFKSPRAVANRLFFIDVDGLAILHRLHTLVLRYPWDVTTVSLQRLEQAILRVLWNITASFDIHPHILRYPFLELCLKSALRVSMHCKGEVRAPRHLASSTGERTPLSEQEQDLILAENIYKAFGVIFNLAELPQCQLKIVSEEGLLKQALIIALSPTYKYIASLVSVAGLVCLAYNEATHPHLVRGNTLWQVLEAVHLRRPLHGITEGEALENRKLLRYFASLLFVQLIASSLAMIPKDILPHIGLMLHEFLKTADPVALHKHERSNGYVWSTIRPHLNLSYLPIGIESVSPERVITIPAHRAISCETDSICLHRNNQSDTFETSSPISYTVNLRNLLLQCSEVGVISLQNMTLGEETRGILEKEGLLDFVVCMPWFLPPGSKPQKRARDLVRSLSRLEPPSLVNIARAKLAADTFGLEKMLNTHSVHELVNCSSVWNNT